MFWQRATQPVQQKKQDIQQIKKPAKATGLQYFSFKKQQEAPVPQQKKRQKSPQYNHFDQQETQAFGDIEDRFLPNVQAQRKRISRTYLLQNDIKRNKQAKQAAQQQFQTQLKQKKGLQRILAQQRQKARQREVADQLKLKKLESDKKSAFQDLQSLKIEVKSIKDSQLRQKNALQQRMHTLNEEKKRQILSKQKAKGRIAQIQQQRRKVINSLKSQLEKVKEQSYKESKVFKDTINQLQGQKKWLLGEDLAARNQIQKLKEDLELLHDKSTVQQKNKNQATNQLIEDIRDQRDKYKAKLRSIEKFQKEYQQSAQKIKTLQYEKNNLLLQKIAMQQQYIAKLDGSHAQTNTHFATIQVLQRKLQLKQDQLKKAQGGAPKSSGWNWGLGLFSKSQPKVEARPTPVYLQFGLQTQPQIKKQQIYHQQVQHKPAPKKKAKLDFNQLTTYQPPPPPKVQQKPAPFILKKQLVDTHVNTERKQFQQAGVDPLIIKQMNKMSQTQLQWRSKPPQYQIQQQSFQSVQPAQVHLSMQKVIESEPISHPKSLNQVGIGPQVLPRVNLKSLGSGDRSTFSPILMSNGQALIAIAPNDIDAQQTLTIDDYRDAQTFYLGQYNSGPPGYFTQRGVRIGKSQLSYLRDIIRHNYANKMPDMTIPIPGTDVAALVDEYKGQIFLGIRHFIMFKGQLHPTRYGFNVTQEQVPKFMKQLERFIKLLE